MSTWLLVALLWLLLACVLALVLCAAATAIKRQDPTRGPRTDRGVPTSRVPAPPSSRLETWL